MGRPAMEVGEHGNIRTKKTSDKPETWTAATHYRDADGVTRPVQRSGPTETAAIKALTKHLGERGGTAKLRADSKVRQAADIYIKRVHARRSAGTHDLYQGLLKNHILPALGELQLRQVDVPRLEDVMDGFQARGLSAGTRRVIRAVLGGVLQTGVRHGALPANPVRSMGAIEEAKRRPRPRALNPVELNALLTFVDQDKSSIRSDLPDLIRVMLGSGLRLGEALGLRWCDLDLTSTAATSVLHVTGNAVYISRVGVVRHDGKTNAAIRSIPIPGYVHGILSRRAADRYSDDEPVFPSATLGYRNPKSVITSISFMRKRIKKATGQDWTWLTSHNFRKTVATELDRAKLSAREIADILGHSNPSLTQNVYMGRGELNRSASSALDAMHKRGSNPAIEQ